MPDQPLVVAQRNRPSQADAEMRRMMMMQQMMGALSGIGKSLQDYQTETKDKQLSAIEAVISGKMSRDDAEKVFKTKIPGGIQAGEGALAQKAKDVLTRKAAEGGDLTEQQSVAAGLTDKPPSSAQIGLESARTGAMVHSADVSAGAQKYSSDVAAGTARAELADKPAERASKKDVAVTEGEYRLKAEQMASDRETARQAAEARDQRRAERLKAFDRKREDKWKILDTKESRRAEAKKNDLQLQLGSLKSSMEFAKELDDMDQKSKEDMLKLANISKDDKMDVAMRSSAQAALMGAILQRHPDYRPFLDDKAGKPGIFWNSWLRNVLSEYDTMQKDKLNKPLGDTSTFSTASPTIPGAGPVGPVGDGGGGGGVITSEEARRRLQQLQGGSGAAP